MAATVQFIILIIKIPRNFVAEDPINIKSTWQI